MKQVTYKLDNYKIKAFSVDSEIYVEIYDHKGKRVFDKIYKRGDSYNLAVIDSIENFLSNVRKCVKATLIERNNWERMTAKRENEISTYINRVGHFKELKDFKKRLIEISEK